MSILDSLSGLLSQQGGVQGLITATFQKSGGFDAVLAKLNDAGYGAKVNSWLGKGPNTPITADEIQSALGNQHLTQLASSMGVPMDKVAALLAQHLPVAVDSASPNGTLQAA
jgi:uncharacterized protein YidB (DUF937 family)